MATFNELYTSVFGNDTVTSQRDKLNKLIDHVNNLDQEDKQKKFDEERRLIEEDPIFIDNDREISDIVEELLEIQEDMSKLSKREKILDDRLYKINLSQKDRENVIRNSIHWPKPNPELTEAYVKKLYRIDRDS